MKRRRHDPSIGEMISTVTFAGVAVWLGLEAMISEGNPSRQLALAACAILSGAGALRFQLQALYDRFNR